jgi:hypothetical protein
MVYIVLIQLCIEILVYVPVQYGGFAPYASPGKGTAAKVLPAVAVNIPYFSVRLPEYKMPVIKIKHV